MLIEMTVNQETCSKCGMCANICGTKSIDFIKGEFPARNSRSETCMQCAQCMAVCPKASIRIAGLSYDDLFELPENVPDFPDLYNLIKTRRSIRHFKDKPVPRQVMEQIVEAVSQAPMGFPPHKTHITVVQNRDTVLKIRPLLMQFYGNMISWMKNPFIRYIIRCGSSAEDFATIKNHLIPLLMKRLPEMKKNNADEITWGAPSLMLFHAEKLAESHSVDACIALTYAFLSAHALGLGVTVSGLLPPAINQNRELKNMLNIPENHEVVCAMMLGYPLYRYKRGIQRPLASVNWI